MLTFESKMSPASIVPAFIKQLQFCDLKPGETVLFLTDDSSPRETVEAGLAACTALGNACYQVRVPSGPDVRFVGANPYEAPGLLEAFRKVDLVVSFVVGFFSGWERAVRESGGRILNILDAPSMLLKLQGHTGFKRVALAAKRQVQAAKTIRVTSAAGTDFSYEVDHNAPYLCHYGAADEPGHMDEWGQCMMSAFPVDGTTSGTVVARPGDMWALPYMRLVQSEIRIEIREGYVRKVSGGLDARLFEDWLAECKTSDSDLDPYAISHLGWGMNPNASYHDVINFEHKMDHLVAAVRGLPGSFLFSTGPSYKRKTRGHIDMPLLGCTVTLDGRAVVRDGRIVEPELMV